MLNHSKSRHGQEGHRGRKHQAGTVGQRACPGSAGCPAPALHALSGHAGRHLCMFGGMFELHLDILHGS